MSASVLAAFKALGIGLSVLVVLYMFSAFALPNLIITDEVFTFLISGNFKKVMNLIYYFYPVDFALSCLGIIYTTKLFVITWRLANRTIGLVTRK